MIREIEYLEQEWEEWKWAKRKEFMREYEFPEANLLLSKRRCTQPVSTVEDGVDRISRHN